MLDKRASAKPMDPTKSLSSEATEAILAPINTMGPANLCEIEPSGRDPGLEMAVDIPKLLIQRLNFFKRPATATHGSLLNAFAACG
jgi:hypothetical protein